jgi:methyl-accepting chemotaxis protein
MNTSSAKPSSTAGIWELGVRLMGRVLFPTKMVIIGLVFLIPILVLGYSFLTTKNASIQATTQERLGVDAYREVAPLLSAVLKVRNATRATLGGFDGAAKFAAAVTEVDAELARFDKFVTSSGDPLAMREHVDKLKAAWAAARSVPNGVDAQGKTVFGTVTVSLVELTGHMGDESGLVLDPDIDT